MTHCEESMGHVARAKWDMLEGSMGHVARHGTVGRAP